MTIALADNISTMNAETNCSSQILSGYKPIYNATVVERIIKANMTPGQKISMGEFGMGKANMPQELISRDDFLALVSDTGGEARRACAELGLTGIKPTYGAVSRYGLIANASSLDQICTIGKNIKDCAALLEIISGADGIDGTCILEKPFDFSDQKDHNAIKAKLQNLKIGIAENSLEGLQQIKMFKDAGASVENFEMPNLEYMIPIFQTIAFADISSNMSKYDGLKYGHRSSKAENLNDVYNLSRSEGFGWETKKKIMLGSLLLSSSYYDKYYRKALQGRSLIIDTYKKLFSQFDIIIAPLTDEFNVSINLAGLPAVMLPAFQLTGPAFSEALLISAAGAVS